MWTRARHIRSRLIERGFTMAEIARRLGVSRHNVSHVVAGRKRSKRVENYVAQILGEAAPDLFGPRPNTDQRRDATARRHRVA